jgi:hypothetical protein
LTRRQESGFARLPHAKGLRRHRKEKALASKLDQLRAMTTVVADTGDLGAVARLKPVDCTTNPTIVLKAVGLARPAGSLSPRASDSNLRAA